MTTVAAGAPAEISGWIPPNGRIHLGGGTFGLPIRPTMTSVSGSKGMTDRTCPAHMVGVKMLSLTIGKVRGRGGKDKSAGWPTGTESAAFVVSNRTMAVGTLRIGSGIGFKMTCAAVGWRAGRHRIGIGPCAHAVACKTSRGRPLVCRAWIGEGMGCPGSYINYAIDMFARITEAVAGCVHMRMTTSAHRA